MSLDRKHVKMIHMDFSERLNKRAAELMASGIPRQRAEQIAEHQIMDEDGIAKGLTYEGMRPEALPVVWRQAVGYGSERLVLELTLSDPSRVSSVFTMFVVRNDTKLWDMEQVDREALPVMRHVSREVHEAVRSYAKGLRIYNLPVEELGWVWVEALEARRKRLVLDVRWDDPERETLHVTVLEVEDWENLSLN
jgi:hypothetical protein